MKPLRRVPVQKVPERVGDLLSGSGKGRVIGAASDTDGGTNFHPITPEAKSSREDRHDRRARGLG